MHYEVNFRICETELANQNGFYISQKNDKIIWNSYPYSDKIINVLKVK